VRVSARHRAIPTSSLPGGPRPDALALARRRVRAREGAGLTRVGVPGSAPPGVPREGEKQGRGLIDGA
jgi:hypothetical protein